MKMHAMHVLAVDTSSDIDAFLGHGNLNGDGFGVGWYCPKEQQFVDPTPCVFTSITPAWYVH